MAHLLADALKNIENEESEMEMLRMAFSQLPAGTAYDVFSGVSKLLVNNKNWRRVQPIIHQEVIERLLQIEKALMTERQTQMNVSGDLVLNKEIKND